MSAEALVRMANQIAANFAPMDPEQAAAATARHIRRFWDPRMRAALGRLVAEGKTENLSPAAARATELLARPDG
jgi:formate dehydrogenase subunit delta